MKKIILALVALVMVCSISKSSFAQLSDEEYNYVTMDLRGILNLTMTTDPQVDFVFKTIQEYELGITKFNATLLEVDATLAWDLFAYASTDTLVQVESYSTNGNPTLPAEVLEMQSDVVSSAPENFNSFISLKGLANSGVTGGVPNANTQFLAGEFGTVSAGGSAFAPGTAAANPSTHKFRIDMRLKPGIPASFPNSTVALTAGGNSQDYAQAGYYYVEVVYTLVEDL